jgi:DNA processing protein
LTAELAGWLRLVETPGIGRESARKLLAAFASPQAVIAAPEAARRAVVGAAGAALSKPPAEFDALLRRTLDWLDENLAEAPRSIVTLGDPGYPPQLLQMADPPLLLYLLGRAELLASPSVAIVGSRNPTAQGKDNARAFAADLSRAGVTIVSGLALGIDGAAHEGALQGAGNTIAVVGTGQDQVYPRRHQALAKRILAERGLIVSEYPLGMPPLPPNFPLRNRIIAGLSQGTLVVEAAVQSGSLITARLASEAGREVFAIPGSIHNPLSRGCHALLRQGAKLVESAADVLEELRLASAAAAAPTDPPSSRDPLLEALGHDPVTLDALVARTGWPAHELSSRLLELELDGQVARLPGQLFQRLTRA